MRFRRGDDIYLDLATIIFLYLCTPKHKWERQLGKIGVLALGFGMSFVKLLIAARGMYGVSFSLADAKRVLKSRFVEFTEYARDQIRPTRPESKRIAGWYRKILREARIDPKESLHELAVCAYISSKYRARYPAVPKLWKAYGDAATTVVSTGESQTAGRVGWYMDGNDLCARLPSGRVRRYCDADVRMTTTVWGRSRTRAHLPERSRQAARRHIRREADGKLCERDGPAI